MCPLFWSPPAADRGAAAACLTNNAWQRGLPSSVWAAGFTICTRRRRGVGESGQEPRWQACGEGRAAGAGRRPGWRRWRRWGARTRRFATSRCFHPSCDPLFTKVCNLGGRRKQKRPPPVRLTPGSLSGGLGQDETGESRMTDRLVLADRGRKTKQAAEVTAVERSRNVPAGRPHAAPFALMFEVHFEITTLACMPPVLKDGLRLVDLLQQRGCRVCCAMPCARLSSDGCTGLCEACFHLRPSMREHGRYSCQPSRKRTARHTLQERAAAAGGVDHPWRTTPAHSPLNQQPEPQLGLWSHPRNVAPLDGWWVRPLQRQNGGCCS